MKQKGIIMNDFILEPSESYSCSILSELIRTIIHCSGVPGTPKSFAFNGANEFPFSLIIGWDIWLIVLDGDFCCGGTWGTPIKGGNGNSSFCSCGDCLLQKTLLLLKEASYLQNKKEPDSHRTIKVTQLLVFISNLLSKIPSLIIFLEIYEKV